MYKKILFRGKSVETNEWVYGDYLEDFDPNGSGELCYFICLRDIRHKVRKETVSQFTGLYDKDHTMIFTGDIIQDFYDKTMRTVFFTDGGYVVEDNPKFFGYGSQDGSNPTMSLSDMQTRSYIEDNCYVIGNVYDDAAKLLIFEKGEVSTDWALLPESKEMNKYEVSAYVYEVVTKIENIEASTPDEAVEKFAAQYGDRFVETNDVRKL